MGSQSASGSLVTVTKSLSPKIDTTPPAANTSRANGSSPAASALLTFTVAGRVVSRVNFRALGLGVGEGLAEATSLEPTDGTREDRGEHGGPAHSRRALRRPARLPVRASLRRRSRR